MKSEVTVAKRPSQAINKKTVDTMNQSRIGSEMTGQKPMSRTTMMQT